MSAGCQYTVHGKGNGAGIFCTEIPLEVRAGLSTQSPLCRVIAEAACRMKVREAPLLCDCVPPSAGTACGVFYPQRFYRTWKAELRYSGESLGLIRLYDPFSTGEDEGWGCRHMGDATGLRDGFPSRSECSIGAAGKPQSRSTCQAQYAAFPEGADLRAGFIQEYRLDGFAARDAIDDLPICGEGYQSPGTAGNGSDRYRQTNRDSTIR